MDNWQYSFPEIEGTATVKMVVEGEEITIELNSDDAPVTASNFVDLVERDFYNGLMFHRVEPDFVAQGGDPQGRDPDVPPEELGGGGFIDPDTEEERNIPLEIKPVGAEEPIYSQTFEDAEITDAPELPHLKGAIAMARTSEPDTASSQFYFALDDLPPLDGNYAVFGNVTDGMDVVDEIEIGDRIDYAVIVDGDIPSRSSSLISDSQKLNELVNASNNAKVSLLANMLDDDEDTTEDELAEDDGLDDTTEDELAEDDDEDTTEAELAEDDGLDDTTEDELAEDDGLDDTTEAELAEDDGLDDTTEAELAEDDGLDDTTEDELAEDDELDDTTEDELAEDDGLDDTTEDELAEDDGLDDTTEAELAEDDELDDTTEDELAEDDGIESVPLVRGEPQLRVSSQASATEDTEESDDIADDTNNTIKMKSSSSGAMMTFGGDDEVYGTDDDDIINGNEGKDTILGLQGDDWLRGGKDDDSLIGGKGDDYLVGDLGADILTGGEGDDIFILRADTAEGVQNLVDADWIVDWQEGEGIAIVGEFEPAEDFSFELDGEDTVIKLASSGDILGVVQSTAIASVEENIFVVASDDVALGIG